MSLTSRLLRRANARSLYPILLVHKRVLSAADFIQCRSEKKGTSSHKRALSAADFFQSRSENKGTGFLPNQSLFRSLASSNSALSCWKCGGKERKSNFFCEQCSALQKPGSDYNFFQLLGVIQTFNLDPRELSKKFRDLQALLHPDKFSNASEEEQSYSAELSSLVNKAFKTLLDPLERGLYLLSLAGHKVDEGNTSFDKTFLLEIMELNEELESISNISQLKEFQSRNRNTLDSILRKVSVAFTAGDSISAKAALMEMKYYTTLEGKIKEKEISIDSI